MKSPIIYHKFSFTFFCLFMNFVFLHELFKIYKVQNIFQALDTESKYIKSMDRFRAHQHILKTGLLVVLAACWEQDNKASVDANRPGDEAHQILQAGSTQGRDLPYMTRIN